MSHSAELSASETWATLIADMTDPKTTDHQITRVYGAAPAERISGIHVGILEGVLVAFPSYRYTEDAHVQGPYARIAYDDIIGQYRLLTRTATASTALVALSLDEVVRHAVHRLLLPGVSRIIGRHPAVRDAISTLRGIVRYASAPAGQTNAQQTPHAALRNDSLTNAAIHEAFDRIDAAYRLATVEVGSGEPNYPIPVYTSAVRRSTSRRLHAIQNPG